jgi:hypothetical protein
MTEWRDGRIKLAAAWTKQRDNGEKYQSFALAPSFDQAMELYNSQPCVIVGYPNTRRRPDKNDPNVEVWVIPKRGG